MPEDGVIKLIVNQSGDQAKSECITQKESTLRGTSVKSELAMQLTDVTHTELRAPLDPHIE